MINVSYIYVLNITHTFFLSTIFPIFGFSYTGSSKCPKEHTDTDTSGPVSQHVWSLQVWTHGDRTGIFSALHDLIARLSLSSCRRHSHSCPACQQDAIKAPPHLLWLLSSSVFSLVCSHHPSVHLYFGRGNLALSACCVAGWGDRGDGVPGEGADRSRREAELLRDWRAFVVS